MKDILDRISRLEPRRVALLAAQLQQRVDALDAARREPIAIVGMACRFPGGAHTPEAFWQLLRDGVDTVRDVPADRWDVDALFDADPDAPGTMSTRWGAFLDDVAGFDAPFFGIAPREATSMDPQQRLLLELAWEAFERAGIAADRLNGSATGVFVGISGSDYAQLLLRGGQTGIDAYTASGAAHSVAAGRISFLLGLQGPCFPIDTACSSSLVAVHQAVQSLRTGECRMAVAGGVNLILSPDTSIALTKAHMMAPDGRCKAFDARADGFVRGEGGALLVLKRLADAVTDGDPVIALIRGSAINQDGRSNGLTAPNGPAQEAVIRAALESGGVKPDQVGYVEAHGTGTSLGDPIEVQAIAAALGGGRTQPVPIGSVKANVGHLESAAGMAGLVKLVLALQHRTIPPQIHVGALNPHIPWSALPLFVPTTAQDWATPGTRIGGVSSFGFSGTNAHVVIEEAPDRGAVARGQDRSLQLLTLSARSAAALRAVTARMDERLAEGVTDFADTCFTANTGRAHHEHRLAVLAESVAECRERLQAAHDAQDAVGVHRGVAAARRPRVAFLFSGQGAQRVNMGRALFESQPVFRAAIERCDALLRPQLDPSLLNVLYPQPGGEAEAQTLLDRTLYTQPALFAIEYALTALWRAWGVRPDAVAGHSIGEYAAACAAGVLSLEHALRLVSERGRLMQMLTEPGAMAAVFADHATVAAALAPHAQHVAIAAFNDPAQIVISGAAAHVDSLLENFSRRDVRCRRLNVSHAFHSPLMEPVLEQFAAVASEVEYTTPHTTFVSAATGAAAGDSVTRADYWTRHIRQPVRFVDAARALHAAGCHHFIEIGPGPALLALAQRSVTDAECAWLPSLRAERADDEQMYDSLARLHVAGVAVDWDAFHAGRQNCRVLLPTYPFQRERYWHPAAEPQRASGATAARGDALADAVRDLLYEVEWQAAPPASVARALADPSSVGARIAPRLPELSAAHGMAAYDALLPRLDQLAAASIVHALARLGQSFTVGRRFSDAEVAAGCGIVEGHTRLLHRLLCVLAEDGVLASTGDEWEVLRAPDVFDPGFLWAALRAEFPQFETELTLVARCAAALADVLCGTAEPLQLLFPDGALDVAGRLYRDAPVARMFNTIVGDAVAATVRTVPAGTPLRVLEVGGGTGGTTASVLPVLPAADTEYVFTDISPHFVQRAQQQFAKHDFVKNALLDIARAPEAQGFSAHSFDIIIAANVLHATPDLRRSLEHVRRLLAPGGMLVLYEAMHPQRFSDLTVGLTAGWWSFTDTDLRTDYALLSRPRWHALLDSLGFTGCTILPDETAAGAVSHQAVLIARAPAPAPDDGAVLVLEDRGGVGRAFAASLRTHGVRVVTVSAGAAYGQEGADEYTLDPLRTADVQRVLVEAAAAWRAVVHLGALDAMLPDGAGEAVALQGPVVGGALALVQALVRMPAVPDARPPRLWLVTAGAQRVDDAGGAAAQTPLWGFGHTVALEHPELRCTRIDLDPGAPPHEAAAALAAEVQRADPGEDRIALRAGSRSVPRLIRHTPSAGPMAPLRIDPAATYLVTGGMRGIGLRLAEWLVERGARNLALIGRAEPSAAAQVVVDRLVAADARIVVARGDVSDRARLAEILAHVETALPPVRGIFHSAGVLDDGVLLQQDWSRFASVMAPKVDGAWNLHTLTAHLELDSFVLFSSGAALLGAAGQANHAAASAFLDGLAHYRRARGLPALVIDWGAWSGIGAAVDRGLEERGTITFTPEQGLAALDYAMRSALGQVVVLAADWNAALARFPTGHAPPFLRALSSGPAERPIVDATAGSATMSLLRRLDAAPPNRRANLLLGHVREAAARVLGIGSARRVPVQQPLQELGLDSLMAVELRNRLGRDVEQTLPATLLYEHATVSELAAFLADQLPALDTTRQHADTAAGVTTEVAAPAGDYIAALLLKKLETLDAAP